jgi:ferritin-like metal-binding protein YciE
MEGLVEEGEEVLEQEGDSDVLDAAIIGAAQRVEHYEIAAYGTAIAHAKALGHDDLASLLGQSLTEEEETDRLLTQIAENGINRLAATMEEGESAAETTERGTSRGGARAKKTASGSKSSGRSSR